MQSKKTYAIEQQQIAALSVLAKEIEKLSESDFILKQVSNFIQKGCQLEPHFRCRYELYTMDNCVKWGNRVVIPTELQKSY